MTARPAIVNVVLNWINEKLETTLKFELTIDPGYAGSGHTSLESAMQHWWSRHPGNRSEAEVIRDPLAAASSGAARSWCWRAFCTA